MLYQLMNKDTIVAVYEEKKTIGEYSYREVERYDEYFPYGFISIDDWIDGRQIAKHRQSIERLMRELDLILKHSKQHLGESAVLQERTSRYSSQGLE